MRAIVMAGSNGSSGEQALVIGAGVAGLSCGLRLHKAGIPFTILESSDGPGGRVRSDKVEGFTLDRGFQIFLTSYPEAQAVLNYADLDLKPFYAGAMVQYDNQFHKVADPLRHPLDGVQSLFNSTGTIKDKVNVGAFRLKSELGSLEDLLQRDETTTLQRLKVNDLPHADFCCYPIVAYHSAFFGCILSAICTTCSCQMIVSTLDCAELVITQWFPFQQHGTRLAENTGCCTIWCNAVSSVSTAATKP